MDDQDKDVRDEAPDSLGALPSLYAERRAEAKRAIDEFIAGGADD